MIHAVTLNMKDKTTGFHIQCLNKCSLTAESRQMEVINQISVPRFALICGLAFQFSYVSVEAQNQKRRSN